MIPLPLRARWLLRRAFVAALAATALGAAACASGGTETAATPAPPTPAPDPIEVLPPFQRPEFVLTDTSGASYDFGQETRGKVTLLYFGYRNCPDICPTHMATIAAALKGLVPTVRSQVTVVFVSVDPARDTPENIRQWLDLWDPSFVGLTGTQEEVEAAGAKTFGSMWEPVIKTELGDGRYTVRHAAFVIAYSKDDQAHTLYPLGTTRTRWSEDLAHLAKEEQ